MAERNRKTNTGTVKKKGLINVAFTVVIVFLVVYAVVSMITQQGDIAEQEAQLQKVRDEITEAQQENDELVRLLSTEDEKAYMERIAIERMGYGYPNEKRYYAMSVN